MKAKPRKWYLLIDANNIVQHGAMIKRGCIFVKHMMEGRVKRDPELRTYTGNLKIVKVLEAKVG